MVLSPASCQKHHHEEPLCRICLHLVIGCVRLVKPSQPIPGSDGLEALGGKRHNGAIAACCHGNQTITSLSALNKSSPSAVRDPWLSRSQARALRKVGAERVFGYCFGGSTTRVTGSEYVQ
jgi:hypothetical protein